MIIRYQNNLLLEKARIEAETLFRMLYITRQWIAENRDLIKPVPAVATKELSRYLNTYDNIYFHITSNKLINPENAPNEFEKNALIFFKNGGKELSNIYINDKSEKIYRYVKPLYINESCLKCHQYQGYKLGDLRGAISIYIPLKEISKILWKNNLMFMTYGLLLFIIFLITLTILIDRLILRGLFKVKNAAERVANGFFDNNLDIKSKDEIGSLAKSFNLMQEKIKLNDQMLENTIKEVTNKYNEALDELKKTNNYKTALLDSIGHEIRTPLTKVVSYSEILKEAKSLDKKFLQKTVDIIYRNVCILNEMFTQIQTMERIKDSEFLKNKETVEINNLIEDILSKYIKEIDNKEVNISINIDKNFKLVGSKFGLNLILENLIQNAVKYVNLRGSINITLSNEKDKVTLIISNTGCELRNEETAKIFGRFYRGEKIKCKYFGTGLGLTIVKSAVEDMGGKIECNINNNKTIDFIVTFSI